MATRITSSQRSDMSAADHLWSGHHSLPRPVVGIRHAIDLVISRRSSSSSFVTKSANENRMVGFSWRLSSIWSVPMPPSGATSQVITIKD